MILLGDSMYLYWAHKENVSLSSYQGRQSWNWTVVHICVFCFMPARWVFHRSLVSQRTRENVYESSSWECSKVDHIPERKTSELCKGFFLSGQNTATCMVLGERVLCLPQILIPFFRLRNLWIMISFSLETSLFWGSEVIFRFSIICFIMIKCSP